jgi:predicted nucleotidyltransferase
LAKHIAEKFQPEEIILFGSHAYGKPQPWSDVDLLVVMETPRNGEFRDVRWRFIKSLPPIKFGLDIIVRSRSVIERRKKLGDWFLIDVTEKGKVLYERDH